MGRSLLPSLTLLSERAGRKSSPILLGERMSNKPALCIQVDEETQLCLLEERHVEEYFALIERNKEHLHEWVAVEAYEESVETLRAFMKHFFFNVTATTEIYPLSLHDALPE